MKSPRFRSLLIATAFALPTLAYAHPGHDGDHELVWDFEHLADHPLATIACVSLIIAAGWGVWRLLKSRPTPKAQRVKRD
jgi:lysylphosphatidylglycerol synthetase-like protein (DUF2156 family)